MTRRRSLLGKNGIEEDVEGGRSLGVGAVDWRSYWNPNDGGEKEGGGFWDSGGYPFLLEPSSISTPQEKGDESKEEFTFSKGRGKNEGQSNQPLLIGGNWP